MSNTEIKDEPSPVVKEESEVKSIAIEDEPADTNELKNASSDTEEEANDKIPFPVVLHELVSDPETDYCIHWLDDDGGNNDLFTISDKKRFAKEILPKLNGHANKAKYTSFTRRLKRWGFHRIASGAQIGAYGNPNFLRDEPERVKNMRYMLQKPLSLTAAQNQNGKLQVPTNITGGGGGAFSQVPTRELRMLQTMLAQQQQMQSNNPMEAYMRLVAGGNGVSTNNNMAAVTNNTSNNPMMQLALLQQMQNQKTTAAAASSADSPKANESYGQMLVRTNPGLAAKVLDTSFDTKGNNMMSPQVMSANSPIMSMLAGQTNNNNSMPMQQQHTMYPMTSQGYPLNLNAMLLALSQQEQQQQQQQKELIKSLANRGPTLTLNHQHIQADVNRRTSDPVSP